MQYFKYDMIHVYVVILRFSQLYSTVSRHTIVGRAAKYSQYEHETDK